MIEPKQKQNVRRRLINAEAHQVRPAERGLRAIQKLLKRVQVDSGEPVELETFRFYEFLVRRALVFRAAPAAVGAEKA